MDEEEAIQSQLAREEVEAREAMATRAEAIAAEQEPAALLQGPQEIVGQKREKVVREESAELGEPEPEPEPSKFDKLMGLLHSGMNMLRSAEFTREETYKVEDMFMDMKHELYQAEKRGRR